MRIHRSLPRFHVGDRSHTPKANHSHRSMRFQDTFASPAKRLVDLGSASATSATSSTSSTAGSSTDSLRQLIAADIKTAYGSEATESDYSYWLPKLQGPCDSGFVTSGQMTGTEYWHRRMLGWQAGGSDMATSGPYAGSPDANGPVPSATDVVGALAE